MSIITNSDMASMASDDDRALTRRVQNGDTAALNRLIQKYKHVLDSQVRYRTYGVPVPVPAIAGKAMQILAQAAKAYDPNSTAAFPTFLESHLRGLNRVVHTAKNVVHLPENKSLQISRYQSAFRELQVNNRRDPSIQEISDYLGWSIPIVEAIQTKLNQKEFAASGLNAVVGRDEELAQVDSRRNQAAEFLYATLPSIEKAVFDYAVGGHGKPKLSTDAEIGLKVGLHPGKVNRIRKDISAKIKRMA